MTTLAQQPQKARRVIVLDEHGGAREVGRPRRRVTQEVRLVDPRAGVVHPPARDEHNVRRAAERLGIAYPVAIDSQLELWDLYGNQGWPARYLWDAKGALFSLHYGEGAYQETELEIQELLGIEREPLPPFRPEDAPGVLLPAQTEDQPGAYSGPYEAGGAWAVLEGAGEVRVNGRALAVTDPGCYELISHPHHSEGVLDLRLGPGVTCHATCFTPALPAAAAAAAAPRPR